MALVHSLKGVGILGCCLSGQQRALLNSFTFVQGGALRVRRRPYFRLLRKKDAVEYTANQSTSDIRMRGTTKGEPDFRSPNEHDFCSNTPESKELSWAVVILYLQLRKL